MSRGSNSESTHPGILTSQQVAQTSLSSPTVVWQSLGHFHSQSPEKKVLRLDGPESLARSSLYLRYSRKWSLSVLVTTRAMSLQKPRWQALMLSLRRSSWAFPPETRSMSLITQITEHLSMVCRTCPQQGSERGSISVTETAVQ